MIWWEWRKREEEKEPVTQRGLVPYSKEEGFDIRELGKRAHRLYNKIYFHMFLWCHFSSFRCVTPREQR